MLSSLKTEFEIVSGELWGPVRVADMNTELSNIQGSFLTG